MKSMTLKMVIGGILLLVVLGAVTTPPVNAFHDTEVLVLNSYHPGYGWADKVVQGIYDTLNRSDMVMNIHIEYMDGKRYPLSEIQEALFDLYIKKYDPKQLDMIIITDNVALNFAIEYYEEFFQYAPVVFCGIGYLGEYDFTLYPNMTGFGEDTKFLENLQLIEHLQPQVEHLYFITGSSATAMAGRENFHDALDHYTGSLEINELYDLTIEETLVKAEEIPDNSAIILIPYARDIENEFINWDSFLEILATKTDTPIYSNYAFQVTDHVVGGMVIDGFLHGQKTALRALAILNGQEPDEFAIDYDGGHYYLFNYPEVMKHGISIYDLPKGALLLNEPTNAWYRYRQEMLIITSVFLFLVTLVIILLVNIRRRKEAEIRLRYLTSYDAMTGLHNRHAYIEKLDSLQAFGATGAYPVGIIYIDMDGMKQVNDQFGHEIGDDYIIRVAQLLMEHFMPDHFIARIGGDEFIVVKEQVDEKLWLEKIRDFQDAVRQQNQETPAYHFSVSMGQVVCTYAKHLEEAVREADHFMYQSKYAEKEHLKKKHPH